MLEAAKARELNLIRWAWENEQRRKAILKSKGDIRKTRVWKRLESAIEREARNGKTSAVCRLPFFFSEIQRTALEEEVQSLGYEAWCRGSRIKVNWRT